jgi:alkylated DNA repair dioxygenase AlkB
VNVVYLIRAGESDAVLVGTVDRRALARKIKRLQEGNPELLHVHALLDGDERLERELHVRWHEHHRRGDWYRADVLADIPSDARRVEDEDDTDVVARAAEAAFDELLEGR